MVNQNGNMKWNELMRLLAKAGWKYHRDARGSHEYWRHPDRQDMEILIAKHPSKEVGTGLANRILKQAGLK